jgi:multiple sugar transport system substrate-binding protein
MDAIRRKIAAGLLAGLLMSLLAACGGTGTSSGGARATANTPGGTAGGGSTPGGSALCPPAAQGQQISMWSPLTGPDGKFMTDLAAEFSQASGVKVTHLPQPDYLQKLNAAAAASKLPDLTVIRADDIAEMAARNVLKPLAGEALRAAGGDTLQAEFPAQVWEVGAYKGQRYSVPLDVHPVVLYYNKDMFQKAGITMPADKPMTRAEFEQAAEKLNSGGVMGVALGNAFQGGILFWTLLRQFGGSVVSEDGAKAAYNSAAGVQALSYLRDMKQKYSPQVSGAGDPEVKLFQQGKAAMVMHGPWHISDMEKLPFVGFAPMPQIGDQYAVWGGSHQLALTTDDPARQAAAACWIGWLSQHSAQWAKAGQVPVRRSVRQSGELQSVSASVAAFAPEVDSVIMPRPVPGMVPAVWGEGFGKAVDAVLLGQQTDVQQALNAAAARSDQILQQNQQRYGQ